MKIVIPMSGIGKRFIDAGYKNPKPLILVDGLPIISYVVNMFDKDDEFIFICNENHLNDKSLNLEGNLKKICKKFHIVPISEHKLGPVYAVLKAESLLSEDEPVIVNYCDFTCDWDYLNFKNFIKEQGPDGVIPAYRGFHPHTIWSNYYAYLDINKSNQVIDIQEKKPFTDNPRDEFASSGTYYFKSSRYMLKYFKKCIEENLHVSGEFYVSMAYKPMIDDGLNVITYELEHFMQWGTPQDLEEYLYWSAIFKTINHNSRINDFDGLTLMPMAGEGKRFLDRGYTNLKPFIEINSTPMFIQALKFLPETNRVKLISRSDMNLLDFLNNKNFDSSSYDIHELKFKTDGQASTCYEALKSEQPDESVTISACDNGMIYDGNKFQKLLDDDNIDIIVWGAKSYPGAIRSPQMYGWIKNDKEGIIEEISVKKPISKNLHEHSIVIGAFTFKRNKDFIESYHSLIDRDGKVNNEFYVDSLINDAIMKGLKCVAFDVDYYICWGTPDDLETFNYWADCFDKWQFHSFSKDKSLLK